jgi:phospholipase/carboxylesterase
MSQVVDAIEIDPSGAADAAVIWLHGLGADGHDFEPIVPELRLPQKLRVRFVFPHAPVRPVTLNNGMAMRAWYDIIQLGGGAEDEAGIRASQASLEKLIAREKARGIPARRIVLAGFSQGGAIVLQTALRHAERLAGVMALSTYLPLRDKLEQERAPTNQDVPIFMAHGSFDDIIPLRRAEQSKDLLVSLGYAVAWRTYPMPHSVCPPEIGHMAEFLVRNL